MGIIEYKGNSPTVYRATVRRMTAAENGGRHHVYVDALDENGQRVQGLSIGWTWAGRGTDEAAPPVAMDKPPGETAMGNIPIFQGQVIDVWLDGQPSDRVNGLHTGYPPDGDGNGYGHHSYMVVYQRRNAAQPPVTPVTTPPLPTGDGTKDAEQDARLAKIEAFLWSGSNG